MLSSKRIIIIGGSSGIGFSAAELALEQGVNVVIASRSKEKLNKAKKQFSDKVDTYQLDIGNEQQLESFFNTIGNFDHLFITAANLVTGTLGSLPVEDAKSLFDVKFWGAYTAVKHALSGISQQGSITLCSGRLSQRPQLPGMAAAAAVNSAVEGLGRALAVELAPVRVNVVSPGLTDTEVLSGLAPKNRENYIAAANEQALIKRIAKPKEVAAAALFLMDSTYSTGSTLFVDGGYTLR